MKTILSLFLIFAAICLRAIVVKTIWALLVVPAFGFQQLPVVGVVGFLLIIGFVTGKSKSNGEDFNTIVWEAFWKQVGASVVVLIIAYIFSLFI